METYSIQILNPKATKLLQDLADLELIAIHPAEASATENERADARKTVMHGSLGMDLEAVLEQLRESRQDRKLPFRNDE